MVGYFAFLTLRFNPNFSLSVFTNHSSQCVFLKDLNIVTLCFMLHLVIKSVNDDFVSN